MSLIGREWGKQEASSMLKCFTLYDGFGKPRYLLNKFCLSLYNLNTVKLILKTIILGKYIHKNILHRT